MNEQAEIFKCHICNEAEFNSKQKLSVHQIHCKLKHPDRLERSTRVPFGVPAQRFSISKEDQEKYHHHVFNDNWKKEPGRIERALAAGYELVDHDKSGETSGTNEDGSEIKGILMRQPKEMYEADQALKDKEIDKVDEQITRGKFQAGENTYLPSGGIKTEVKLTG
jgi:hypothetical protein